MSFVRTARRQAQRFKKTGAPAGFLVCYRPLGQFFFAAFIFAPRLWQASGLTRVRWQHPHNLDLHVSPRVTRETDNRLSFFKSNTRADAFRRRRGDVSLAWTPGGRTSRYRVADESLSPSNATKSAGGISTQERPRSACAASSRTVKSRCGPQLQRRDERLPSSQGAAAGIRVRTAPRGSLEAHLSTTVRKCETLKHREIPTVTSRARRWPGVLPTVPRTVPAQRASPRWKSAR